MIVYKIDMTYTNAVGTTRRITEIVKQENLLKTLKSNIGKEVTVKPIGVTNKIANLIRTDNLERWCKK